MQVSNALEDIVPATIERLVADHDHLSGCDACKSDVLALSLSKLQPGYSSTDMGRILKRIDTEKAAGRAKVAVVVLAAIKVVKQNPHHEL